MKTATKVFMCIGIASGVTALLGGGLIMLLFLAAYWSGSSDNSIISVDPNAYASLSAVMPFVITAVACTAFFGVGRVVVGSVTLGKFSRAKSSSDVPFALKLFMFILGDVISGVMLLCMKDADYLDAPCCRDCSQSPDCLRSPFCDRVRAEDGAPEQTPDIADDQSDAV